MRQYRLLCPVTSDGGLNDLCDRLGSESGPGDGAITHHITGDTSGDGHNQSQVQYSGINKTFLTIITTATAVMNVKQSIALKK